MTRDNQMTVEQVGETDIVVRRRFNASPALVWRAHTEPELVKQWMLGPDGWTMPVCEIDLKVGGKYKHRWRNSGSGDEFGFYGEFTLVEPHSRLGQTEYADWMPGAPPANNVLRLEPEGDGTLITLVMTCFDADTRQAIIATGMVDGMSATYDRLEDLLPGFN